MFGTKPPVSLEQWVQQVNEDPSIPERFKNGKEVQLQLTDNTFRSGSLLNSTDFLHLRTIFYPCSHVESLGDMMKNDPQTGWTGLISAENLKKAEILFNEKRSSWKQYLNELEHRQTEDKPESETPASSLLQRGAVPRQPLKPSIDCGLLVMALLDQTSVIQATAEEGPTTEELEQAYTSSRGGNVYAAETTRFAVNQPIPPITPKLDTRERFDSSSAAQSTPEVVSYQPARGGHFNPPAADEELVSAALLSFLKALTLLIGNEFINLNWLGIRLPLRLSESVTTADPDTGHDRTEFHPVMEARVDGYLYRTDNPFEQELKNIPLAIIEVKPFSLGSSVTAIRRQIGAEMASWISQAGDSTEGLLQSSESGRKRRPMLAQLRHEIYIIIGEYGASFEAYIRPSRQASSGSPKNGSEGTTPPLGRPIAGYQTQVVNPLGSSGPKLPPRPLGLLRGSPSYIRRVETSSIRVSGDSGAIRRNPQPTQLPAGIRKSTRTKAKRWNPDPGDFLILHEFGPFIIHHPSHMDLFIRRYIALMLELRGPQHGFIPDTVSTKFLDNSESRQIFVRDEAPYSGAALRKARSW